MNQPTGRLRLWPGIVAVALQWILWLVVPKLAPDLMIYAMLGAIPGGALTVLVWWLFFSRAPRSERWVAIALMILGAYAIRPLLDKSIATGAMGVLFILSVIPTLCLALVLWAVATRNLAPTPRRAALLAAVVAGSGCWALMRTDGITGEGSSQLKWRWTKTSEQKLLAQALPEPVPPAPEKLETPPEPAPAPVKAVPVSLAKPVAIKHNPPDWPGFRGPHRDDVVTGLRIETNWTSTRPQELWRRAIGPGWSSFAVGDGLIYTQEQRGDFEVVSCYKASTGEPVWIHRDPVRFYESNAGPGPRGTPALHIGRVYSFGATGILNALDSATGRAIWSRTPGLDTKTETPQWGFASSPLVVDDEVVVAAAGQLIAYDLASGNKRWTAPRGGGGYASPQLISLGGVDQVLLSSGHGTTAVSPADGKVLWTHDWRGAGMLQPTRVSDSAILVTTGDNAVGLGTRRLAVSQTSDGWKAEEVWTSNGLKPYFNDIVVHKDHAYGFDGAILSCIDVQDGKRMWKGGRYGHGQLLLLADQDLLVVLTEEGEIALVSATPDQFAEIAKIPAIEGKTWNHPVIANGTLFVRNGQEMAAFRLPHAGG
jgi:outer membrane protein assembly factor BamB